MQRIVRAAINATLPGGRTHTYFTTNPWEAEMREQFRDFADTLAGRAVVDSDHVRASSLLRLVNARYSARYAVPALPIVAREATQVLMEAGRWQSGFPNLLTATADETVSIAATVQTILSRVEPLGIPQPYSVLTKWLHFCFPDTFVIFDSQAAKSLTRSADHLYAHVGKQHPLRRRFRSVVTGARGGSGYIEFLHFYQECWEAARTANLTRDWEDAAARMEVLQHEAHGTGQSHVSILDVLDKHLWMADGNHTRLGLTVE